MLQSPGWSGRWLGVLDDLPAPSLRALRSTEDLTAQNDGMLLRLAISYGSRSEIADATRALVRDVQDGRLAAEDMHIAAWQTLLTWICLAPLRSLSRVSLNISSSPKMPT